MALLQYMQMHAVRPFPLLTGGQQVVDVDQEALLDDLVVCHEERDGRALGASLAVQAKQVLLWGGAWRGASRRHVACVLMCSS